MRKTKEQMNRLAALLSLTVFGVAEALAQENQVKPARRIVVSIPDRKLALIESGRVLKVFPTAVGAPRTPSPTGSYQIVKLVVYPTWYTKGKVVPPGKSNPLGTRWLGLSAKGYGIHGTNTPSSIGANVSHGCIRMRNRDVEELFALVSVGDSVDLYNERTPELDSIFGSEMAATGQAVTGR
jgi:lipoprotein-anchoring transpeptidase ErfK/SrfK